MQWKSNVWIAWKCDEMQWKCNEMQWTCNEMQWNAMNAQWNAMKRNENAVKMKRKMVFDDWWGARLGFESLVFLNFLSIKNGSWSTGTPNVFFVLGFRIRTIGFGTIAVFECVEIHAFLMILSFPRFPLHRRNHENVWNHCISHDSGLPTLATPPKKSWKRNGHPFIFNDSGLPTLPSSLKKTWTKDGHLCIFQWFWASHASHSTEEIMKNVGKSMHSQWFWVSHASHSTKEFVEFVSSISVAFFSEGFRVGWHGQTWPFPAETLLRNLLRN